MSNAITVHYRKLALAQLALVLLLVPLIALWPRPGMAVLILPLPGRMGAASLWAREQGLPLLGRGIAQGSLIMAGQRPYTPFSALSAGALVVAVPDALCQSPRQIPRPPSNTSPFPKDKP